MGMRSKAYTIEFNKLRPGANGYEFDLDAEFLKDFELSPIKNADIKAITNVEKSENMMEITTHLKGTVVVNCDSCLAEIPFPVNAEFGFLIKMSEVNNFDDPEMIYLSRNEISYDLSQFLYESILLGLPARKSCEDLPEPRACDTEMLKKFNDEGKTGDDDSDNEDPRWEKLKDIIK